MALILTHCAISSAGQPEKGVGVDSESVSSVLSHIVREQGPIFELWVACGLGKDSGAHLDVHSTVLRFPHFSEHVPQGIL